MHLRRTFAVLLAVFLLTTTACGGRSVVSAPEFQPNPIPDADTTITTTVAVDSTAARHTTKDTTAGTTSNTQTSDKVTVGKVTTTTTIKTTVPSTGDGFEGTTYYVSFSDGDDQNDGKSPTKAVRTLTAASTLVKSGDRVLFKRGDVWRGEELRMRSGVTYGAYGSGAKPRFYGSEKNYADKTKWKQTADPRVWVYDEPINTADIGGIVFNDGKEYAIRRFSESELDSKHEYYYGDDRKVYLFSRNGNPGEAWTSIEFLPDMMIINGTDISDVTVRDIDIRYSGRMGIYGDGTTKNFRVENCEFYWIGGVLWGPQFGTTRLGNAVTFWGSCYDIMVTGCQFDQIFDTAFSPQYESWYKTVFDNIEFSNNVVNRCHWSIEVWISYPGKDDQQTNVIKNVRILNNVMRNAGCGWSANQRGTAGGLQSAGHFETMNHQVATVSNILIKGNVFDGSAGPLLASRWNNCMPTLEGNTYIQKKGKVFGCMGSDAQYLFDDKITDKLLSWDKTAKVEFSE